jgi:hypothetical protein
VVIEWSPRHRRGALPRKNRPPLLGLEISGWRIGGGCTSPGVSDASQFQPAVGDTVLLLPRAGRRRNSHPWRSSAWKADGSGVGTTSSFFHGFAFLLSSDVGWPHAVLAPVMLSLKAWFKVSFSFPIFCPLTACIGASVNSLGLVGAAARSRFRSLHTPENLFRFLCVYELSVEGFRRVGGERL